MRKYSLFLLLWLPLHVNAALVDDLRAGAAFTNDLERNRYEHERIEYEIEQMQQERMMLEQERKQFEARNSSHESHRKHIRS